MKLHWGHGIAIFLICYIGVLLVALFASMRVNHSLVAKDYYAEDLSYQSRYEKEANQLEADNLSIDYNQQQGQLLFSFDKSNSIAGTIHLYRPSDASLDITHSITTDLESIDTKDLQGGKWKVKVDWTVGGQSYYKEQDLFL